MVKKHTWKDIENINRDNCYTVKLQDYRQFLLHFVYIFVTLAYIALTSIIKNCYLYNYKNIFKEHIIF